MKHYITDASQSQPNTESGGNTDAEEEVTGAWLEQKPIIRTGGDNGSDTDWSASAEDENVIDDKVDDG